MKHAFLILAHNNFEVIKSLLHQLDDEDFDIYIHINARVKLFPKSELENSVTKARLFFVERFPIGYCDYSMVDGVKSLMKTASEIYHDYYHLISGADMMIKTRKEFKEFFEKNQGMEFVGFSQDYQEDRVKYRNYFVAKCRQKSHWKSVFFIKLRKLLIELQKKVHFVNHVSYEVKKGPDWYSITHEALVYILEEEPAFMKCFYRSYCPTEFLAQTILWNSPFKKKLYKIESKNENVACVRLIDWERGKPYIYKISDRIEIEKSAAMFARKFDEKTDMQIVTELRYINEKEK